MHQRYVHRHLLECHTWRTYGIHWRWQWQFGLSAFRLNHE